MEALGNLALDRGRRYVNLDDNLWSLETKLRRLVGRKTDLESQVTDAERSGTKKRKREVEIWFEEVATVENEFRALKKSIQEGGFLENAISSGDRVAKMDAIVEQLMEQSNHFDGLLLEAFENRGEPRVTTKLFGEMFDRGLKAIWAWLVIDSISNIGIYGMGGVGKTTLAKHIHNHLLNRTQFKVYWITVSQEFSIKKLQDNIAKRLRLDLSYEDDEDSRAAILSRALVKQSVLILDDVWQEFSFEKIGIPLGANKCRVILTTRSLVLCNRISCQRVFEAKTLATNEAWDLFKHTLDPKTVLHEEVEEIAKSVAKRCSGLPLGIVTVAGSMRGVNEMCDWRNALKQLKACSVGHDEMERDVFPILEWSFNRLNECQRNCFLYCSLYPEDYKIKREELIDLFIWAELMSKRGSRSKAFDEGQTILNKLIRLCLLEETKDFKGDDCVKMHDLVRDMALRITHGNSKPESSRDDVPRFLVKSLGQEDSQATALEQEEWTQDLRAVSFYAQCVFRIIEIPPAWSPNCPKLSTLLLSDVFIKEIPDSFFQHMCGLKVLNLSRCGGITELPNSVSNLVDLTALILGSCGGVRSMPPLGKLKQMRDLDLSSTQIRNLPQDLESLVNLERLNLKDCIHLRSVPPLGKLKQLRDLDLSKTKIEDLPQGWESLVNLERLNLNQCWAISQKIIIPQGTFFQFHRLQLLLLPSYGRVQVNDPEVLNQLEGFIGCLSFMDFYKIIRWPKYYNNVYINDILNEDPSFVNEVRGFPKKQLHFHQCKLGRGSNYLPDDMESLIIEDCEGMGIRCLSDVFKNFINLSHLSRLDIKDLVGVEFLWQLSSASPCDQLKVSSFSPLCGPKILTLYRLPNLVGLFYGESEPYLLPAGTFSSLRELWISGCHNMKQLFTVQLLQNLQNLEELDVTNCDYLEEIAADDDGVGQGGGEGIQLTSSEATATVVLPKLGWLGLENLPQLKNICKAAMICKSIWSINILDCRNLKRLPWFLSTIDGPPSPPSTLEIIGEKEWWESLEWDNSYPKDALDPLFSAW
ncbi:probable disease resistance protein At4g27220 [Coffea eugenioides]|uniref:probable disease resistance protein At4g27220 n=1 Tax=Coffea eugenioides TaxID=49369 RepID=UPI000F614FAC|nr:probable disease resistance protein At4g27220 [Coffea eugenioides]